MNIRPSVVSRVAEFRAPTSTLLNPAVRGITPVNSPARSLAGRSSGPSVRGLVHSAAVTATQPTAISTAVTPTVILVWTVHCRGRRTCRRSSNSTGNPSPPATTAAITGTQTHGSAAKRTRLSGYNENPALLNAETAWNSPR
jgi:hypothetical protein